MDIGKSFSYPFEDKQWLSKLALGVIISIVPILNFAWAGYVVDLIENVMNKIDEPLPEWTEFGEKFMKGLFIFVAALVYALPVLCLLIIFAITTGTTVTRIINYETWNTVETIFTGVGLVLSCLTVLYGILLSFFYPAMLLHFAQKETFGSLFEVGSGVHDHAADYEEVGRSLGKGVAGCGELWSRSISRQSPGNRRRGASVCDLWVDPPGQVWEDYRHATEEWVMPVEGRLELEFGGRCVRPEPGEEILIPAGVSHTVRNIGGTSVKWLYGYSR